MLDLLRQCHQRTQVNLNLGCHIWSNYRHLYHLVQVLMLITIRACWRVEVFCLLISNWCLKRRQQDWSEHMLLTMEAPLEGTLLGQCWRCPTSMFLLEHKDKSDWTALCLLSSLCSTVVPNIELSCHTAFLLSSFETAFCLAYIVNKMYRRLRIRRLSVKCTWSGSFDL